MTSCDSSPSDFTRQMTLAFFLFFRYCHKYTRPMVRHVIMSSFMGPPLVKLCGFLMKLVAESIVVYARKQLMIECIHVHACVITDEYGSGCTFAVLLGEIQLVGFLKGKRRPRRMLD